MTRTFTDLTEIKLILLFILKNVPRPVSANTIHEIIMKHYDINYFTLMQYLTQLVSDGYVTRMADQQEAYTLTEKGENTLLYFLSNIPAATKDWLLKGIAEQFPAQARSYVQADFTPQGEHLFRTDLSFVENQEPLFSVHLWTSSRTRAKAICQRFEKQYEIVYNQLIRTLAAGEGAFRTVIFDLDGTLVNTLNDLSNCMNAVLESHGFPIHKAEAYRTFVGDGVYTLAKRALPKEARTEEMIRTCAKAHKERYQTCWHEASQAYDGIEALLSYLQYRGIKICVLTNKPHESAQDMIAYYFPNIKFDMILGQQDGKKHKPDPAGILEIQDELGIKPGEILYVGDSDVDMQTAKNANVFAIGALWGFRTKEELLKNGADFIAEHPLDVLRFFDF